MRGVHARCETERCGRPRQIGQEMCFACWQRLPRDQRAAIMAAQRAGRFRDRAELGRHARAWLAEHGPDAIAARRAGERP